MDNISSYQRAAAELKTIHVSFEDFEQYHTEGSGAINPFEAAISIIGTAIKTVYHLAMTVLAGVPQLLSQDSKRLQAGICTVCRDIEEGYGFILSLFDEVQGSYHLERSAFFKEKYEVWAQEEIDFEAPPPSPKSEPKKPPQKPLPPLPQPLPEAPVSVTSPPTTDAQQPPTASPPIGQVGDLLPSPPVSPKATAPHPATGKAADTAPLEKPMSPPERDAPPPPPATPAPSAPPPGVVLASLRSDKGPGKAKPTVAPPTIQQQSSHQPPRTRQRRPLPRKSGKSLSKFGTIQRFTEKRPKTSSSESTGSQPAAHQPVRGVNPLAGAGFDPAAALKRLRKNRN